MTKINKFVVVLFVLAAVSTVACGGSPTGSSDIPKSNPTPAPTATTVVPPTEPVSLECQVWTSNPFGNCSGPGCGDAPAKTGTTWPASQQRAIVCAFKNIPVGCSFKPGLSGDGPADVKIPSFGSGTVTQEQYDGKQASLPVGEFGFGGFSFPDGAVYNPPGTYAFHGSITYSSCITPDWQGKVSGTVQAVKLVVTLT